MCFMRENREAIAEEVGTTDTATLSKVIGERWAQLSDRSLYEQLAAKDRSRHDREMVVYEAALGEEHDAEQARLAAAAAGPSEREMERAEKRARLADDVEARAAQPKKERKAKVLNESEKQLRLQNKEIEQDKARAAKQRLNFLLGQSDLFRHFGMVRMGTHTGGGKPGATGKGSRRISLCQGVASAQIPAASLARVRAQDAHALPCLVC
jgi:SWI/SNF-related matrix-associated actin-dependent regulator of chromatin subfamily A member 5